MVFSWVENVKRFLNCERLARSIHLYRNTLFRLPTFKGDDLGNIKQTHIKNVALDLVKKHTDEFKHDDFQHNKEKVGQLAEVSSKLMRNKIAGYITRYLASRDKGQNNRPISE